MLYKRYYQFTIWHTIPCIIYYTAELKKKKWVNMFTIIMYFVWVIDYVAVFHEYFVNI